MAPRTDLQELLEVLLGSEEVYFQPPSSDKLSYPCIIYKRSNATTKFANNNPYLIEQQYTLTLIAQDPDSGILAKLANLPRCVFSRHFTADNLNHDVFSIYY